MHVRTPRLALALALLTLLPSAAGCVAADAGGEDLDGPPSTPLGDRLSATSVGAGEVNDPEATVNDPEVNDPEATVNDPEVNDPEARICLENDVNCDGVSDI